MAKSGTTFDVGELRQQAAADYRRFVAEAAEGKRPNMKQLRETLWAAGRDLADFQVDVARLSARHEAQASIERAAELGGELADARAEEAAAEAHLAEAKRQAEKLISDATAPCSEARDRREWLQRERDESERNGRRVLLDTGCPKLKAELSAVESTLVEPGNAARELPERRRQLDRLEAAYEAGEFHGLHPQTVAAKIAEAGRAVAAGERAESMIPEGEARLAELRARLADPVDGMDWTGDSGE